MADDVIYKGRYIWDREKNEENKIKHKISFEEACTVYDDPFRLDEYDDKNSMSAEERYNIIGLVEKVVIVFVSTTERNEKIRIISARRATAKEQERYNENLKQFFGI